LLPKFNSFSFRHFSAGRKGRAACILNMCDGRKIRTYNIRFDQSMGERLVHIDFSFYDRGRETKLIAHRPLDFEEVFSYNRSIFIAMMFAGMFDAYFTTLIKKGIMGLEKLASQNSMFQNVSITDALV
jgi:hypothetical protein